MQNNNRDLNLFSNYKNTPVEEQIIIWNFVICITGFPRHCYEVEGSRLFGLAYTI